MDVMVQTLQKKMTDDDKAIFAISMLFLVVFFVRMAFGYVAWHFLIILIPMFFVALLRPKAGLSAILILTVLFERFFTLEALQFGRSIIKLYPLDMVLFGVYGGMLAKIFLNRTPFLWKQTDVWLMGFFVLATLYFGASFFGFGNNTFAVAFSTWKNYVFYGMLFFAVPILCEKIDDLRQLIRYFLFAVIVGIVFVIIGVVRGNGLWTEFTPLSTEGVRLLAFPHAFYFSLAFLGMLVSVWYWEHHRYRFFLWLAMALWSIGIIGSLMRHMWIGIVCAVVGALVIVMDGTARRAMFRLVGIAFSGGTVLVFLWLFVAFLLPQSAFGEGFALVGQTVRERVTSITNIADESISWRGSTWHSAFVQLARNPMFGTGFGMHIPVESGAYRDFIEIRNIHNSWLVLLVQMGIVGFFTFIVFVSTLVWKVFALHPVTPFFSLLRSVSLTLILYQGIVFLAQPYLETNMLGIFFWMTLGMTNALIVIAHKAQYPSV